MALLGGFDPRHVLRRRRSDRELADRRATLRSEIDTAIRKADRASIDRLRARCGELDLSDDTAAVEIEMIDGLRARCDLAELIAVSGVLPVEHTFHRAIGGDECHFLAPVSRVDGDHEHTGKLFLTNRRMVYVGGPSVVLSWTDVVVVHRADRDLVVTSRRQEQLNRFRFNSFIDAMRAELIARQLVQA